MKVKMKVKKRKNSEEKNLPFEGGVGRTPLHQTTLTNKSNNNNFVIF